LSQVNNRVYLEVDQLFYESPTSLTFTDFDHALRISCLQGGGRQQRHVQLDSILRWVIWSSLNTSWM